MCDDVTLAQERAHGRLFRLCTDFPAHLLALTDLEDVRQTLLATEVLSAFGSATAAVFELDYFDTDYRSEFSATHETTFAVRNPGTTRLHLFDGEDEHGCRPQPGTPDDSLLAIARSAVTIAADGATAEPGHQQPQGPEYLGYVVLRPQAPGTIGRSIVPPRARREELSDPSTLGKRVRTGISEEVELFGVRLTARGVPFMEQDGQLLRCVHAAAWMAHYTATLRGIVARRRTADIHRAEDDRFSMGRRFPSPGLTDESLSRVLGRIGLPAEFIDRDVLEHQRPARWFDRRQVWQHADDDKFWIGENLTATICRYLNSGLPVILARNDLRHAQVVCGYVRHEDLDESRTTPSDGSRVSRLVVHDDQDGPYRFESVASLVDTLASDTPERLTLLAPLPAGLWLSGEVAELFAAEIFEEHVKKRHRDLDHWATEHALEASEIEARRTQLKALVDAVRNTDDRATEEGESSLAIRSAALTGTDFKQGFIRLVGDKAAAEVAGFAKLPKYVWAVEILDRALRRTQEPSEPAIIGTIVVDASTVVKRQSEIPAVSALLVHLPGQISTGPDFDDRSSWMPVGVQARFSCRWHHERDWLLEPKAIAARSKLAT
jgi:hypothetical protein